MASAMTAPTNTTIDPLADHSTARRARPVLAVLVVALLGVGLMACTSEEAATNNAAVNTLRATVGVPELPAWPNST